MKPSDAVRFWDAVEELDLLDFGARNKALPGSPEYEQLVELLEEDVVVRLQQLIDELGDAIDPDLFRHFVRWCWRKQADLQQRRLDQFLSEN